LWCVYCTKLEPISKIKFGELSPFHHDPASAPQHARGRAVPLLLCRTALASPPSHSFLFGAISFFDFRYGGGEAREGFLLEGKTGGIHSVVISFFVVLKMDLVLPNYFLGVWIWQNRDCIFRLQKGVWGMNAGGLLGFFLAAAIVFQKI